MPGRWGDAAPALEHGPPAEPGADHADLPDAHPAQPGAENAAAHPAQRGDVGGVVDPQRGRHAVAGAIRNPQAPLGAAVGTAPPAVRIGTVDARQHHLALPDAAGAPGHRMARPGEAQETH